MDEVVGIHDRLLKEFGGSAGIRDLGMLESAVYRPQTGYYDDLSEMAAALLHSLLMNHAFVDGNKRTAVAAADVFLRLNGLVLAVDATAAEAFLLQEIQTGGRDLEPFTKWIRHSSVSS